METQSRSARTTGRIGREMKRTAKTNSKGGGGFGDRWIPPKSGELLTPVILFPGQYSMEVQKDDKGGTERIIRPYSIIHEHYSKKANKFIRCTAGLAFNQSDDGDDWTIVPGTKNCVGCHEYFENGGKQSGISLRKVHIFNGILLAHFHWIEKKSAKGTKYKEAVQCTGKRCKLCSNGVERSFGRRIYWPLGPSFVEHLSDFDTITLAKECKCGGTIDTIAFECPACQEPFRDFEDEPVETEKEMEELRSGLFHCHSEECDYYGFMDEVPDCDSCNRADPLKLWDVVVEVYRSGEGPTSKLAFSRHKYYSPDKKKKVASLMKPIDVDQVYPLINLNAQAKRLGKDNPFGSSGSNNSDNGESEATESVPGSTAWDNM